jgi:hypothetical protein
MEKKRTPWNKGLTKEDSRVMAMLLFFIVSQDVKKFWDKNKTTEKVLARNKKISEKMLGKKKNYKIWNDMGGGSKNIKRKTMRGIPIAHLVWCETNKIHRVPNGCIIHHIDCNPNNNSPENLQLLEDRYHRSLHNQLYKLMKRGGIVSAM